MIRVVVVLSLLLVSSAVISSPLTGFPSRAQPQYELPGATRLDGNDQCSPQLHRLLSRHMSRYPLMKERDALKLLQQVVMGSEHAIADTAQVVAWMDRELSSLGSGPAEPLVDTLATSDTGDTNSGAVAPAGNYRPTAYARVHLRAFRAAGGDPSALVSAFIRTGREAGGDTAQLSCAVQSLKTLVRSGHTGWSLDSIDVIAGDWARRGYPAMGHSAQFRDAYRPAYRVIAVGLIPTVFKTQREKQR